MREAANGGQSKGNINLTFQPVNDEREADLHVLDRTIETATRLISHPDPDIAANARELLFAAEHERALMA